MYDLERALERLRHGCEGTVTRQGEEDSCGKPAVAIIDGRDTEELGYWFVCTYHAHRNGHGRVLPLSALLGVAWQRGHDSCGHSCEVYAGLGQPCRNPYQEK